MLSLPNNNTISKKNNIPCWTIKLYEPDLWKLANVLENDLRKNFKEVLVGVTMCPDLTSEPFKLAAAGLCGDTAIMDIGGFSYIFPFPQKKKWWHIQNLLTQCNRNRDSFVLGSGTVSQPFMPYNGELIMNATFASLGATTQVKKNASLMAFIDENTGQHRLQTIDHTGCSMRGNFFISNGEQGNVLRVYAKKRIGSLSFTKAIQMALYGHFNNIIGLGGTFVTLNGKVLQSIIPRDFPQIPLKSKTETHNSSRYYNMQTPMTIVGTLVNKYTYFQNTSSYRYPIYLTPENFHGFSHEGLGGHYCIDSTPDTIEYLGYFNLASKLYRVDQANSFLKY